MDDCANIEKILNDQQKTLTELELKAAIYTTATIPSHLKIELDDKREEVAKWKAQLKEAQLPKKEAQQLAPAGMNSQSPMRSQVPDKYYIERDEAKRLLECFAIALKQPEGQPLLFNICGIGGVGKTTLLGRLQKAHAGEGEVDFLEVCFTKTAGIETPVKLMRKLHQQAKRLLGSGRW